MKIISKYKDYYDWCQSIFGIDDNIVLDRRVDELFNCENISNDSFNDVSIAGKQYFFIKMRMEKLLLILN